jgi:hypothetical protein
MAHAQGGSTQSPQGEQHEDKQKDKMINDLQAQLEEQRRVNEENAKNIQILLKSVDRNKIAQNTPKSKTLPLFGIALYDGRVVDSWARMTANNVHVNSEGTTVVQKSKFHFADTGEEVEMNYIDFWTFAQKIEVQCTKIENIVDDYGDVIDVWYHFEYEDQPYRINKTFINP